MSPYQQYIIPFTLTAVFTIVFTLYLRWSAKKQADVAALAAALVKKQEEAAAAFVKSQEEVAAEQKREFVKLQEAQTRFQEAQMRQAEILVELKTKDQVRAPFFDDLQRSLAVSGHRPSPAHARKDALLEKLTSKTLTLVERQELMAMAQAEIDNPEVAIALGLGVISDVEKLVIEQNVNEARLLLAVIPMARAEQKARDVRAEDVVRQGLADAKKESLA